MKGFVGIKCVLGSAMTLGEYNDHQGWTMPADQSPDKPGYLVEYEPTSEESNHHLHDGYISWSPAGVFEKDYFDTTVAMPFEAALHLVKKGYLIQRKGWNGKGMHIEMRDNKTWGIEPFFVIKGADGRINTWVPSVSDLLAEDWVIVQM